jgi:hypothetical protein
MARHRHESKQADLMAVSCANSIRLGYGWMQIIVDMDGFLMRGFQGEALT